MVFPLIPVLASPLILFTVAVSSVYTTTFERCLRPRLPVKASLTTTSSRNIAPRWSGYKAPIAGHVVNVSTEADVQAVVRCANEAGVNFFAQSGGSAWATTWNLTKEDVVINLRPLHTIAFTEDRTRVTVEGGVLIKELVDAAYHNHTQVVTANCNCVGVMGALLGGGYSRMMGTRGMMVDNVISMRVVLASGALIEVTPSSHPDLWWALRGAGANFGIVTSAVFQAYPTIPEQNGAWLGSLVFDEAQIEDLVSAIDDLTLTPQMAIFLYYTTTGPAHYIPTVVAFPFYLGANVTAARDAFAPLLRIGPVNDTTTFTPYDRVNAGSDSFCVGGHRKVGYGAGESRLDPATWRTTWNQYTRFLAQHGGERVGNSTILMEAYSLGAAKDRGDSSSSYAWRSAHRFNTMAIAWYADSRLDGDATSWASEVRERWRETSGLGMNSTYINFAFGDESLADIYGDNVARLRALKSAYDPDNKFRQFFPLE